MSSTDEVRQERRGLVGFSDAGSGPIKKLDNATEKLIYASTRIPSYHKAVEELIRNSLCSNCKQIEIIVNIGEAYIEISDDGTGISHENLKGRMFQWNTTSWPEESCDQTFRGASLASLAVLSSSIEVSSRDQGCKSTFTKRQSRGPSSVALSESSYGLSTDAEIVTSSGTRVVVSGLFSTMAVRRKAMQKHNELSQIREFVQNMAVLHHRVAWRLKDLQKQKVVVNMVPQLSVGARLTSFHGADILCKMKEVSVSVGDVALAGLLSPPVIGCCHHTSDCQYVYVNNQWVGHSDLISSAIDKIYKKSLTQNRVGGPTPMHYTSAASKQAKPHPVFVLQLTCPTAFYELIIDGDIQKTIYKDRRVVVSCVQSLLLQLFAEYRPDDLPWLRETLADYFFQQQSYVPKWSTRRAQIAAESSSVSVALSSCDNNISGESSHAAAVDDRYRDPEAADQSTSSNSTIHTVATKMFSIAKSTAAPGAASFGAAAQGDEVSPNGSPQSDVFRSAFLASPAVAETTSGAGAPVDEEFYQQEECRRDTKGGGGLTSSSRCDEEDFHQDGNDTVAVVNKPAAVDVGHGGSGGTASKRRGRGGGDRDGLGVSLRRSPRHLSIVADRLDQEFNLFDAAEGEEVDKEQEQEEDDNYTTYMDENISSSGNSSRDVASSLTVMERAASPIRPPPLFIESSRDYSYHNHNVGADGALLRPPLPPQQGSFCDQSYYHDNSDPLFPPPPLPELESFHDDRSEHHYYRGGGSDRLLPPAPQHDDSDSDRDDDRDSDRDDDRDRGSEDGQFVTICSTKKKRSYQHDAANSSDNRQNNRDNHPNKLMKYAFGALDTTAAAASATTLLPSSTICTTAVQEENAFYLSNPATNSYGNTGTGSSYAQPPRVSVESPSLSNASSEDAFDKAFLSSPSRINNINNKTTFTTPDEAATLRQTQAQYKHSDPKHIAAAVIHTRETTRPAKDRQQATSLPLIEELSREAMPVSNGDVTGTFAATRDDVVVDVDFEQSSSSSSTTSTSSVRVLPLKDVTATNVFPRNAAFASGRVTAQVATTLPRSIFKDLRVVGQADAKFIIAATNDGLILAIDQHAADERVMLESLIRNWDADADASGGSGDEGRQAPRITTPSGTTSDLILCVEKVLSVGETIEVNEELMNVLQYCQFAIEKWGFQFHILRNGIPARKGKDSERDDNILSRPSSSSCVSLTQVPVVLGDALTSEDFVEYLRSLSQSVRSGVPLSIIRPPAVRRIAAYRACRRAVKFGEVLSEKKCSQIIDSLSRTDFPFQCAHGRPSIAPLLNMNTRPDAREEAGGGLSYRLNYDRLIAYCK